jgi:ADP-ribose pyrophosphatase YjhB (NUDIX family)
MSNEQEVHFEGKIAQKVILVKGDTVLLVQDPRGGTDVWELPGGRMNIGEDPKVAIQREFFEEMGSAVEIGSVVHMEQFIQGNENAQAFVIVYKATLVHPEQAFVLSDEEVSKVQWFTREEIKELKLYPEYKNALEVYFAT